MRRTTAESPRPAEADDGACAYLTTDREPDKIVDGVKIFVHWIEPTPAQRQAMAEWWREIVGAILARKVAEGTRISED
jgi:hypothetical protein